MSTNYFFINFYDNFKNYKGEVILLGGPNLYCAGPFYHIFCPQKFVDQKKVFHHSELAFSFQNSAKITWKCLRAQESQHLLGYGAILPYGKPCSAGRRALLTKNEKKSNAKN